MVKDFVRVVLEHHGLINPGSNTKPGMVHTTYSHWEAPVADGMSFNLGENDKEDGAAAYGNSRKPKNTSEGIAIAHINLKTAQAAFSAHFTMAGHRLWGKPLVAAVFSTAPSGMVMRANDKPVNGKEPVDLDKEFNITSPDGEWTWGRNAAGKITKMATKDKQVKKRQASAEGPSHQKRAPMTRAPKGTSSTPSLDEVQEKVNMPPPPTQSPLSRTVAGGYYEQYPACGWVQDCYEQYPACGWVQDYHEQYPAYGWFQDYYEQYPAYGWVQDYYGRWFPYQPSTLGPFYGHAQVAELEAHVPPEAPAYEVHHPLVIDGAILE
ncbi:MAG: hypothetical protein Q9196_004414 [Gyalolechia fulgens]